MTDSVKLNVTLSGEVSPEIEALQGHPSPSRASHDSSQCALILPAASCHIPDSLDFETSIQVLQCEYDDPLSTPRQKKPVSRTVSPRPVPWTYCPPLKNVMTWTYSPFTGPLTFQLIIRNSQNDSMYGMLADSILEEVNNSKFVGIHLDRGLAWNHYSCWTLPGLYILGSTLHQMSELPNSGRDIHWYTSGGRELPVRNRRYRCMNTCSHRQKFHKSLDIRLKSFLSSVFDNLNEFLAYNRIAQLYQHLLKNTKRVTKLPQYRDHENQHNTRGLEDTEDAGHLVPTFVEVHPHCSSHFQVLPRALVTWYQNSSKDIHTVLVPFASSTEGAGHLVTKFVEGHPHYARPICKFYRGRWSLGTKICRSTSTLLVPFPSSTEGAGHLVHKFVEGHPHCARPICKFYRGRCSTEDAGHLVHKFVEGHPHCARSICKFYRGRWSRAHKFVEGHPHCARPICKFYRGRWSLGTKICRSTSTLLVPFPSSTEGAGHLVPKFVEVHPHSSSHLQVLLRALVTWYINSSKDIHTVLVPFASSTEGAGHLVHKFVEGHPHCARPICKFYRGRWSLGTKICRSTSTLLVPFASSTEGAGHLVPKFVEGHPHCARPISNFYRGRRSLGTKICRSTSTLLVPFPSSTEGAGHLVHKFVEGHPHCARPICKFYRGRWSLVLLRALVTWYQNSSKDIHTVLVPIASSTEGAGHLVHKFVEGHPHCARPICKFYRGRWSLGTKFCRSTSTLLVPFASSTEGAGHLVPKFVEGHPHCARPICKFYRGRWSLGTKIRRRTSTLCSSHLQVLPRALVTWYQNSSKDIHTVLVPFPSSTEGAGHLVQKFVEVHPHCMSHFQVLPRALVTWYINSSKDIHTVLVPFASSTEGAGHLVHKFVEGHPHCARPICKFYRGRWSLGSKIQVDVHLYCPRPFPSIFKSIHLIITVSFARCLITVITCIFVQK
ncbi:hypothetical protein J6590_057794 [Homalodisca vitripennis]|nr:hypothetical protein J6590_057794 [Homalodisca vitripennis]